MPNVRITSDWGHRGRMEWAGAPAINAEGSIDRSIEVPEEAYQRIEVAIAQGGIEGDIYLEDGSRFRWFLDR